MTFHGTQIEKSLADSYISSTLDAMALGDSTMTAQITALKGNFLVQLDKDYKNSRTDPSALSKLICEAYLAKSGADIAFVAPSLIRSDW